MIRERIGEWFMTENLMDRDMVNRVLTIQKHGDRRKFGQIALAKNYIRGKDLRKWMEYQL